MICSLPLYPRWVVAISVLLVVKMVDGGISVRIVMSVVFHRSTRTCVIAFPIGCSCSGCMKTKRKDGGQGCRLHVQAFHMQARATEQGRHGRTGCAREGVRPVLSCRQRAGKTPPMLLPPREVFGDEPPLFIPLSTPAASR
ncbi:hypothetical protein EJ06DRAFT_194575 [Trichodelitschia bisporula]|uniref:Uncharacterized protein n=1 Tax=Trichodelitschia bisporula TaxID=703511 RepID=A0A6G1I819_9PEZI|nr:hypothetical protein EJ06DRAFT_194575 [Trichodelitschia bisporula]